MARPERLELPALGFEVQCSIQLSYGRVPKLPSKTRRRRHSNSSQTEPNGPRVESSLPGEVPPGTLEPNSPIEEAAP